MRPIAVAAVAAVALSSTGCATMFRGGKTSVRIESEPAGATAAVRDQKELKTPADVEVPRSGLTEIRVAEPGYFEHRGVVRKHVNGWWLLSDVGTCVIPVLVCVPLIVDAVSGAWNDVDPRYRARLLPIVGAPPTEVAVVSGPAPALPPAARPAVTAPPPPVPGGVGSMSESERKAAARAAYQEGVELQAQKSYEAALERFQTAQRNFEAPPHLVHMAQCYAALGKLVEAYETYETLTHQGVPPGAPEPFREAVETGKKEIAVVRPRIPSLRIDVQPAPSTLRNLTILVNGRAMPVELVGIARPLNPGRYTITATAWGIAAAKPVELVLGEGETRKVDVKLGK